LLEYGESHRHPVNKVIHWVCVPAIMLSIVALAAALPDPFPGPLVHWGTVLVLLVAVYSLWMSWRLGLGMCAVGVLLLAGVWGLQQLPVPVWTSASVVFVVAWLGQLIGHWIEGRRPSFFKDLQFLLIGPLWLLAHLYRRVGVRF
jgi:uncharacterized membrane protein YGL010W